MPYETEDLQLTNGSKMFLLLLCTSSSFSILSVIMKSCGAIVTEKE